MNLLALRMDLLDERLADFEVSDNIDKVLGLMESADHRIARQTCSCSQTASWIRPETMSVGFSSST